jgi:hypothetical protein
MEGIWSLGPFLIPIVAIAGGIIAGIVHTVTRARVRELEIRERIAMIERGMVPPPETDPEGFDRRMEAVNRVQTRSERGHIAPRHRSAGVILMSIGVGMYVLISFAGGLNREALGVGGFIAILGLGFFVNSLFFRYQPPPSQMSAPPNDVQSRPGSGS